MVEPPSRNVWIRQAWDHLPRVYRDAFVGHKNIYILSADGASNGMLSFTWMNIQTTSKPTLTSNLMEVINACCYMTHDSQDFSTYCLYNRTPNISGTSSIIGFNSVLNVSNVFPFLKYLPVNVDSKDSGPILFSKWIPRAHQQKVSSFTHKAVVNPQNEPLWNGHFADVQVFLCSSTPLRRVVGEYWRSCSLTRIEWFKLYSSPSPTVFGKLPIICLTVLTNLVFLEAFPNCNLYRNGTLSWWICQYP